MFEKFPTDAEIAENKSRFPHTEVGIDIQIEIHRSDREYYRTINDVYTSQEVKYYQNLALKEVN